MSRIRSNNDNIIILTDEQRKTVGRIAGRSQNRNTSKKIADGPYFLPRYRIRDNAERSVGARFKSLPQKEQDEVVNEAFSNLREYLKKREPFYAKLRKANSKYSSKPKEREKSVDSNDEADRRNKGNKKTQKNASKNCQIEKSSNNSGILKKSGSGISVASKPKKSVAFAPGVYEDLSTDDDLEFLNSVIVNSDRPTSQCDNPARRMCGRPPTKHRDTEQSQEITGSKKQKIFPTPHEKPAWWSFRIPKKRAQ